MWMAVPWDGTPLLDIKPYIPQFDDRPVSECAVAELLLSWIEWVEFEVQGIPDLLEGLSRLKGALMAAATSAVGRW